jgi:hypothetical protein
MKPTVKSTVVLVCLVLVSFLTASAQRHRNSYSVHSRADSLNVRSQPTDYSALSSASTRQKAQQKDLKKLEEQFARLSGTSQRPSRSRSQQIKPLKIDEPSRRGGGINFTGKSQKTHGTSGARGRGTGPDLHSLRAMHSGTH